MIQRFVNRFVAAGDAVIPRKHPEDYTELVKWTIAAIAAEMDYITSEPDPNRVHVVDDGDYQGTMLFLIAAQGYQPSEYFYVTVAYGSCSGCDTLARIRNKYSSWETRDEVSDEQYKNYRTLALHIVQGIKELP